MVKWIFRSLDRSIIGVLEWTMTEALKVERSRNQKPETKSRSLSDNSIFSLDAIIFPCKRMFKIRSANQFHQLAFS